MKMNFSVFKIIIFQRLRKVICRQIFSAKSQFFSSPLFILSNLQHITCLMQISHGVKDEDMQNILPESSLCLG